MANFKNIIRNPFSLSIFVTSLLFIGIAITGYNSNLHDFKEVNFDLSFGSLFIHNSILSIMNVLGILTFGLYNLYVLFINAFDLGNILSYNISNDGLFYSLRVFIPHAIFELPSMIISLSIGFFPFILLILKSQGKLSGKFSLKYCAKIIVILIIIVLLLNLVAALMESQISS